MQKYIKNYIEAKGFVEGEFIPCEICGSEAVDIHHILLKSLGGTDDAENLIALCRKCHILAHEHKLDKEINKIKNYEKKRIK